MHILAAHDVRCLDPRAEADWCPCIGRVDRLIATAGRCEERHLFEKCGRCCRAAVRHGTGGEVPVRPMECGAWVHELDSRAEADWCPCRGRVDRLIATTGRCEEWHLFEKCCSGWRIFGKQSTGSAVQVRILPAQGREVQGAASFWKVQQRVARIRQAKHWVSTHCIFQRRMVWCMGLRAYGDWCPCRDCFADNGQL